MKICAYVQTQYSKTNYKNECLDNRQFAGLKVIIHALKRNGYEIDYAGIETVHNYDIILISLTSDCDWWTYITERLNWKKGNYKIIIGGAGLLHVTPFLPFADFFVLGRGENTILELINSIKNNIGINNNSIIESKIFNENNLYIIKQEKAYEHKVLLSDKNYFDEKMIGCNHKCLFCGYTWHRKHNTGSFNWDAGIHNMSEKECAMLDFVENRINVDFSKLRTTAIDGFSERLRYSVNKKISYETLCFFLKKMIESNAKPHQVKLFNICGLPGETLNDWNELIDAFKTTENLKTYNGKKWSIVLHSTPFRAMPATPLACKQMSYKNYRGMIGNTLGKGLKGGIIYQGKTMWSVESMGTESLSTVILSAIANRGNEKDTENIIKLCKNKKFWAASSEQKQMTLEKYFNVDYLFKEFNKNTLPNRYLRTYAKIEKMWEQ